MEELVSLSPISFPFHLVQFLSNFFKYSFSNFLLSHPNKILAVNFPGDLLLLSSSASGFNSISTAFCFPFLFSTCYLFLLLFLSQIFPLIPFHSSNFLIPPKCLPLLYNPSISLNTLVFPSFLIYPKSSLLHISFSLLSSLEEVGFSSVSLPILDTSLFFSY